MAARSDLTLPEIVDLSQLSPADLEPLLTEETAVWQQRFRWDFSLSVGLLRRFLQLRALYGCALCFGHQIIGYSYYVCEGRKGLIGDLYLREQHRNPANETRLLSGVVQSLMKTSGVRRIESQLMLLGNAPADAIPFPQYLSRHDRHFMEIDQTHIEALSPASPSVQVRIVPWLERHSEDMAHVLSASYRGHVDSDINDQYRNIPGARQFLSNIIKYPGCGRFAPEASVVALDSSTGRMCGMCLTSRIAETSGHLTQVCVLPALRGAHLGYELIRQTLLRLTEIGCKTVSLTVTCSNVDAVRLYQSLGFTIKATFPALVWEGF